MLGQGDAIHELTRNDTKHNRWFELFRVISGIAFLLFGKKRKGAGSWTNRPPDATYYEFAT
jgi:hypothetical protein